MWSVNAVLAIIETLTVHLMDKGSESCHLSVQSRYKNGSTAILWFRGNRCGLQSQEPSEAKRDRKKKKILNYSGKIVCVQSLF